MKHKKQNEKLAESQSQEGILNVFFVYQQSNHAVKSQQSTLLRAVKEHFLISPLAGLYGSFIQWKSPPGSSHSPRFMREHPPANKAGPLVEEPSKAI